eukprot:14249973-Alexandrium_andersonii.AAC.1
MPRQFQAPSGEARECLKLPKSTSKPLKAFKTAQKGLKLLEAVLGRLGLCHARIAPLLLNH